MISVEHLTKCYGDFLAVDDLSFEIGEGHVYGFLGPNGAGKSTTMNIMTGCLSATAGTVKIGGFDIFEQPKEAKKLIGYLPEHPPLYMNESPVEYLRFVGEAKGLSGMVLDAQVDYVIEKTKIEDVRHRRISNLSKGYKQRVGIAQALLGNPKVIVLDEPTVGLDPLQIIEIRDLIKELGKSHTVIFSSHILSEVQAICDKILIISKGRLVAFEDTDSMEKNMLSSGEIHIKAEGNIEYIKNAVAEVMDITETEYNDMDEYIFCRLKTDSEDINAVSRNISMAMFRHNVALVEISVKKATLEDVFIELTESDTAREETAEGGERQ